MTAQLTPIPLHQEARRWSRSLVPSMLVGPAVVSVIGCLVLLLVAPGLPSTVTLHWGADGERTGSPYVALVSMPITLAVATLMWVVVRRPADVRRTVLLRVLVGAPLWLACFLTVSLVGSVVLQARPGAPVPGAPLLAGLVLGLLAVRPGERLVWLGRAVPAPGVTWAALGALGAAAVAVAVAGFATQPWVAAVALVPALLLPLVASALHWRVRIDARGVAAVGALGFPAVRVPLEDVASTAVSVVAPVGDFGGVGLRFGRGVTAVATRGGEAMEVTRIDGRRVVLTVDDAATAVGVLQALRS